MPGLAYAHGSGLAYLSDLRLRRCLYLDLRTRSGSGRSVLAGVCRPWPSTDGGNGTGHTPANNRDLQADSRRLLPANPGRGRWSHAVRGIEENLLERAGQVPVPHQDRHRGQRTVLKADPDHIVGDHRPG